MGITILRLVLGLVIAGYSLNLLISQFSGHPQHILLLLGTAELAASILLLLPGTVRLGGIFLVAVFASAALIHILHREYSNIGSLAIYAAAALAIVSGHNRK